MMSIECVNPPQTKVDKLLTIQRFSHVMHLVSEVSGLYVKIKQDLMHLDLYSQQGLLVVLLKLRLWN